MASPNSPEVSAAKIGVIGALAGAVIGLLGAGIPAILQIQAARDQANTEFLREQRQEAYAALISAHTEAYVNAVDVLPDTPEEIMAKGNAITAAASAIQIIGSEEARKAAAEVEGDTADWLVSTLVLKDPGPGQDVTELQARVDRNAEEQRETILWFIKAARDDLGVPPE